MKKNVLLILLLISLSAIGQNSKRIAVKGKVIVEKSDVEGISVQNKTSNSMVFTNEAGEFLLEVKPNDLIEVSALQYQNIVFTVNEAVVKSGIMKIYLIEEINQLDEVVVSNNKLTGNLEQDMEMVSAFQPKMDAFYFGISNNKLTTMKSNMSKLNSVAIDANRSVAMNPERLAMINGLDIINVVDLVLLPLFRAEVEDKKSSGIPRVPVESIKYYFGSEFLVDNFNIPEHRVEEFIRFVESENFDFSLLNYGKEMEFLELLNKKSKEFINNEKS
jgi:hypothetical protein